MREAREDKRRSRSRDKELEAGNASRSTARQRTRSKSRSRHRPEGRDSGRNRQEELSHRSSRTDHRKSESSKERHSSPRTTNISSRSSQSRRCDGEDSRHKDGPAADGSSGSGVFRRERQEEKASKQQYQQHSSAERESRPSSKAVNGIVPSKRSLSPSQTSINSSLKDGTATASAAGGKECAADSKQETASAASKKSTSSDKFSRLERFRALKKQKQQPEQEACSGVASLEKDETATEAGSSSSGSSSSNAFNDWLPSTPNVKFSVSSSSTNKPAENSSASRSAAAREFVAGTASASAAAAAVAAAQAVASAALAAAGLAAASAAAVPASEDKQEQRNATDIITDSTQVQEQRATPPTGASTATTTCEVTLGSHSAAAAVEGGQGTMKPPKPMSRNRLKKHQQAQLLKQLQHKTAALPEAKGDEDLLDAFMSALETEAKDEVRPLSWCFAVLLLLPLRAIH